MLRANAFVRTTSRFDYQPDICKDYKETGFCGFGDTCVFLHDRGDYSKGYEIEQEWQRRQREKKAREEEALRKMVGGGESEDAQDEGAADGLPFACKVCKSWFKQPIVTICGHYLCGACAKGAYKRGEGCPVCAADMQGVFNRPRKLIKRKEKLGADSWEEFWNAKGGKAD